MKRKTRLQTKRTEPTVIEGIKMEPKSQELRKNRKGMKKMKKTVSQLRMNVNWLSKGAFLGIELENYEVSFVSNLFLEVRVKRNTSDFSY